MLSFVSFKTRLGNDHYSHTPNILPNCLSVTGYRTYDYEFNVRGRVFCADEGPRGGEDFAGRARRIDSRPSISRTSP